MGYYKQSACWVTTTLAACTRRHVYMFLTDPEADLPLKMISYSVKSYASSDIACGTRANAMLPNREASVDNGFLSGEQVSMQMDSYIRYAKADS